MTVCSLSNEFALKTNEKKKKKKERKKTDEEQLSSFPPLSVQVWHAQRILLDSSGNSVLPCCSCGWFVLFFSTKVDANNMIPKTSLVNSSWLETRKFVNGWFDITANKKRAWEFFRFHLSFVLSLILCLQYLRCFIMCQLSDCQARQCSASHQGIHTSERRSISLQTAMRERAVFSAFSVSNHNLECGT